MTEADPVDLHTNQDTVISDLGIRLLQIIDVYRLGTGYSALAFNSVAPGTTVPVEPQQTLCLLTYSNGDHQMTAAP